MSPLIKDAIAYATAAHGDTLDGNGTPVIAHVLAVALSIRDGFPEHVIAAAVLHDVVEDTPVNVADIREAFGNDVANLVRTLTREKGVSYFAYIQRIILSGGRYAIRIKLADVNHNLSRPNGTPGLHKRYNKALDLLLPALANTNRT